MKYYVLEGTFAKDLPEKSELQKAIDAHLEYLKSGFDDGSILVSGPKAEIGGGIIVVKCDDIEKFCDGDPLVKAGIQEYRITEFKLHNCQDYLKMWFR
ncbi:YciI family protein [Sediminispirochaeta bajacaliforniensis]|uniref:YciI family protein n=1 Tax=Sediminispirochaeta bajacaliforniensis TaxID=148 RepID=UPI00037AC2FB|nr:YciI family protein [Sediminispirochaeta bajacaliforniensis]